MNWSTGGTSAGHRRRQIYAGVTVAAVMFAGIAFSTGAQRGGAMFSDIATPELAPIRLDSQGACWADVDGDGDQDLFVASFRRKRGGVSTLWRNDGPQGLQEIETLRPRWPPMAMGCAFVDIDNDGDPDLYVTSKSTKFAGHRRNAPSDATVKESTAAILESKLFLNAGGTFRDITAAAGVGLPAIGASSVDWADYDSDGYHDAFVATRTEKNPNFLLRQVAPLQFRDVASAVGLADPIGPGTTFLGSWMDYDGDGDLDILLAMDWWGAELFRNDAGTFVRVTQTAFPRATDSTPGAAPNNAMGVTWGDYNNDGCIDAFISGTNIPGQGGFAAAVYTADAPSRLYRNRCDGTFEDVTRAVGLNATGLVEWSANFVDFDNDGDLDLSVVAGNTLDTLPVELRRERSAVRRWITFVVSVLRRVVPPRWVAWLYRYEMMIPASGAIGPGAAMPIYLHQNRLVETGAAKFADVSGRVGVGTTSASRGSAWADFDGDGDLDWFVPGRGTPNHLFRNNGPVGNYLRVRVIGNPLRDAVGAWVKIKVGGGHPAAMQVRHVHVLDGYLSQSQLDPHFGLGKATMVDEVAVRWPGTTDWIIVCRWIPANQAITIEQAGAARCSP